MPAFRLRQWISGHLLFLCLYARGVLELRPVSVENMELAHSSRPTCRCIEHSWPRRGTFNRMMVCGPFCDWTSSVDIDHNKKSFCGGATSGFRLLVLDWSRPRAMPSRLCFFTVDGSEAETRCTGRYERCWRSKGWDSRCIRGRLRGPKPACKKGCSDHGIDNRAPRHHLRRE